MRRPYVRRATGIGSARCRCRGWRDDDDAVDVVRHHDERVQPYGGKMRRDRAPNGLGRHPGVVQAHPAVHDFPEQFAAAVRADRDEVRAGQRVVVPAQSERLATMPRRIELLRHHDGGPDDDTRCRAMRNRSCTRRGSSRHIRMDVTDVTHGASRTVVQRTRPGVSAGPRVMPSGARQTVIAGWLEGSMMSPRWVMTLSISPYALASSADM